MERLREMGHLRLVPKGRTEEARPSPPRGTLVGTAELVKGREPFFLTFDRRQRGVYVSGKPRTGKSTFLLNLILDDFRERRPAFVIDPHGELIDEILRRLLLSEPQAEERVLVFDPTFLDYPIGIDLLDARDEFEEDRAIQFLIELVESVVPVAEQRGPVLYQGIRNSMRLLFEAGGSLAELPEILTNKSFRSAKLTRVRDPLLRRYWESIWPSLERSDMGSASAYFSSKFSQFLDDRALRNIFGQRSCSKEGARPSGLDFNRAIAEGDLVLFDLARGRLGNFNSRLLGLVAIHCIERAVMRLGTRKEGPLELIKEDRGSLETARGVTVAIDECHEFQVEGLSRMITALPKCGASLVLANQSVLDVPDALRCTVLASIETFVSLRQGHVPAMHLEDIYQPRFNDSDLVGLRDHEALFRGRTGRAQGSVRLALAPPTGVVRDEEATVCLRRTSATRFGRPRQAVEDEILAALLREERQDEPQRVPGRDPRRDIVEEDDGFLDLDVKPTPVR